MTYIQHIAGFAGKMIFSKKVKDLSPDSIRRVGHSQDGYGRSIRFVRVQTYDVRTAIRQRLLHLRLLFERLEKFGIVINVAK